MCTQVDMLTSIKYFNFTFVTYETNLRLGTSGQGHIYFPPKKWGHIKTWAVSLTCKEVYSMKMVKANKIMSTLHNKIVQGKIVGA